MWTPASCGSTPATLPGTRIEETEVHFAGVEQEIRNTLPAGEIDTILDNIGIPNAWDSIAQGDVPNIAATDGEILISLNREKHGPVRDYEVLLRKRLNQRFPDMVFFFEPANITNQILNFGLPAPIDLQVVGRDIENNYKIARKLRDRIARIPGAADVHIHQVFRQPQLNLNVDRVKAEQLGLTQHDVSSSMLISLSGTNQVAPNFWMNPANGVTYNVGVQTSQYRVDSLDELLRTPITAATGAINTTTPGSLAGVAASGDASVGASPSGASQAYGNPGAMTNGTQLLSNLVDVEARLWPRHRESLQRGPGVRCLRQRRSPRFGKRRAGSRKHHERGAGAAAARNHIQPARRVRDHAGVVRPARAGDGIRGRAGVSC